jgi:hypothetical protein
VGDQVRVAATKATDGSLQAVMVEVMPKGGFDVSSLPLTRKS